MEQKGLNSGLKLSLISLTLGGFTIGMTEFLMMGVLPDVSRSLNVSIPSAGHLIAIYALGVVIGAPLLVSIFGKYPPKKVLMALVFMMFVFNALFAIAPTYNLLMFTRFLCGLPHGAFFGVGAVVASKLAEPGREARAVSVMFAGLTIANIIGVPIGTYIGHHFDWRISFGTIAIFALLTLLAIKLWMPFIKGEKETSFKSSLVIFKSLNFWLIMGITAIGTGGLFAWISYIAPLMINVAGFSANSITIIMIIIGVGMATGNFIGGRLADRYSPIITVAILLITMVFALLLLVLVIHFKVPTILMIFLIGGIGFAVIAPLQILIMQYARGAEMLASSVLQATANIGNALGAFLGGLPIAAGYDYTSAQYVGATLAFCGLIFCLILYFRSKSNQALTVI